jgi:hypothetical protein
MSTIPLVEHHHHHGHDRPHDHDTAIRTTILITTIRIRM